METFFLSYTEADGVAPYFQLLEDEATHSLIQKGAPALGRTVTTIQQRGTPEDPILRIVAVTDRPLTHPEIEDIGQGAINWCMERGHIPFRT